MSLPATSNLTPVSEETTGNVVSRPAGLLSVYVAASSSDNEHHRKRVRTCMDLVRHWDGVRRLWLSHDWLSPLERDGRRNEELSDEERREVSAECWDGVRHADVLWVLASEWASEGAGTELGIALESGARIVVSGFADCVRRNVFGSHAHHTCVADVDAFRWIVGASRRAA